MRNTIWTLVVAGTAMFAATPAFAELPPPSLANDCGRTARVDLKAIPGTHIAPLAPQKSVLKALWPDPIAFQSREQGAMRLQVRVDQDGKPAEVTVLETSAPETLEIAVIKGIRERYRWEAPPPECRDKGVTVRFDYVTTQAPVVLQIYNNDPRFPAGAPKMGGSGMVAFRYDGPEKITIAKVGVSTGSTLLDDAMIKAVTEVVLEMLKTDPPKQLTTASLHVMFMPYFISSPRQVAAAPAKTDAPPPPTALVERLQTPSLANDCGRTHLAYLQPLQFTQDLPYYPTQASSKKQEGRTFLRLLVNKDGLTEDAVVIASSGRAIFDDALVSAIKGKWRWQLPPPECAARGTVIPYSLYFTMGGPRSVEVYLDDPDYPEQARAERIGGSGSIQIRVSDGKVIEAKVERSSGSAEMDAAMMQWMKHQPLVRNGNEGGRVRFDFVPTPSPENIDVLMGPPAPRPDH